MKDDNTVKNPIAVVGNSFYSLPVIAKFISYMTSERQSIPAIGSINQGIPGGRGYFKQNQRKQRARSHRRKMKTSARN